MPAYDIDNAADRLRLALDQPTRWRRQAVANMIGRRVGHEARQELIAALQQIARGKE